METSLFGHRPCWWKHRFLDTGPTHGPRYRLRCGNKWYTNIYFMYNGGRRFSRSRPPRDRDTSKTAELAPPPPRACAYPASHMCERALCVWVKHLRARVRSLHAAKRTCPRAVSRARGRFEPVCSCRFWRAPSGQHRSPPTWAAAVAKAAARRWLSHTICLGSPRSRRLPRSRRAQRANSARRFRCNYTTTRRRGVKVAQRCTAAAAPSHAAPHNYIVAGPGDRPALCFTRVWDWCYDDDTSIYTVFV